MVLEIAGRAWNDATSNPSTKKQHAAATPINTASSCGRYVRLKGIRILRPKNAGAALSAADATGNGAGAAGFCGGTGCASVRPQVQQHAPAPAYGVAPAPALSALVAS